MSRLEWQEKAMCRTIDAALFTADAKPSDAHIQRLGLICAACPVTRECAQDALQTGATFGMRAGVWIYSKGAHRTYAIHALKRKAGQAA